MEGKRKTKFGKYNCRVKFTIVGLTKTAMEDMNKLLAKEGKKHG